MIDQIIAVLIIILRFVGLFLILVAVVSTLPSWEVIAKPEGFLFFHLFLIC